MILHDNHSKTNKNCNILSLRADSTKLWLSAEPWDKENMQKSEELIICSGLRRVQLNAVWYRKDDIQCNYWWILYCTVYTFHICITHILNDKNVQYSNVKWYKIVSHLKKFPSLYKKNWKHYQMSHTALVTLSLVRFHSYERGKQFYIITVLAKRSQPPPPHVRVNYTHLTRLISPKCT